jgi:hypothetical protein
VTTTSKALICPHCKKPFSASLLDGEAARYRGFKCPHCRLFVPAERVSDTSLPSGAGRATE